MATHSSVLAWSIPETGEFGGLPSVGSHRVGHDWHDLAAVAACVHHLVVSVGLRWRYFQFIFQILGRLIRVTSKHSQIKHEPMSSKPLLAISLLNGSFSHIFSLVAQMVKNLPAMQEFGVQSLGLGRSSGGGHGNPLQYSCLENRYGQRSLAGYSSWGCKESDMIEQLTLSLSDTSVCSFQLSHIYIQAQNKLYSE